MACKTFELDSNGKKIREISDAELKLRLLEDEELYNKVTGITPKTWDIKKLEEEKQRMEDIFREMEDINLVDKDGWIEDNVDYKEGIISEMITPIDRQHFSDFGDINKVGGLIARNYFARKGVNGSKVDVLAQEMSQRAGVVITPEDIINFMIKYPSGVGTKNSWSENTFYGKNNPNAVVSRMKLKLENDLGTKLTPERERILYEKWKQIDERLKEIDARNLTQDELNAMQDEYSEYYKNLNNEQREQLHAEERIEAGENQPMESETDAESESTPRNDRPDTTSGEKGKPTERTETPTKQFDKEVGGGETKKTLVTKRAYEGEFREGVKDELEKLGLTRGIDSFDVAERNAKRFIEEVGEETALEAIRNNDVDGAMAAFVYNEITKSIESKLANSKDLVEIENLQKIQAELLNEWGIKQQKGGAFNGAMAKILSESDLGYSFEKQVTKWKELNDGEIPKDVEERFRQYDSELNSLKKQISEVEKKLKEAEEKDAFDDIFQSVKRNKRSESGGRKKIAEGLDELANAIGAKLSAVGDERASATKALVKISEGLIEEGFATTKNIIQKLKEYVDRKFKGKIDVSDYESDINAHFEGKRAKVFEKNGKIQVPDKLIREIVESGVDNIEDLVAEIKAQSEKDFPNITDREIRDAITKYGKIANPTKDEISSKISKMKRIGRILSQLEDVSNKIRPLKSGFQREKLSVEERSLLKRLRQEMKDLPIDEETLANQIKTVLDANKQRISNRIEDLQNEIANGEKVPKKSRTKIEDDELNNLKAELEKVKLEHEKAFEKENEKESIEKRLTMSKNSTLNRIEDLQRRLREGDFSKKEKKPLIQDNELTKLRSDLLEVKEKYDLEFYKHALKNRTSSEKAMDIVAEAWSLPRAVMATGELSFVLIQGLQNTIAHPKEAAKAFGNAIRVMSSEKAFEEFSRNIKSQEFYPIMKASKLALTEAKAELTAREELFYSGWTNAIWNAIGSPLKLKSESAHETWEKLNPASAIERASVGYLNTQRVLRFMDGMEMLKEKGISFEKNPDEYKQVADMINTFSGRASLGNMENISKGLTTVFFSPRNWASALKTTILLPRQLAKWQGGNGVNEISVANKMAISDLSKFVGLTTSMVMMAAVALNNDEDENTGVEFDPRSTDFMKIKIGDKRIDPWGGKIQQVVFASRMILDILSDVSPELSKGGYKRNGEIVKLGIKYKSPTKAKLIGQQAVNKLAPTMSLLYKYVSAYTDKDGNKTNEYGQKMELSNELKEMARPIFWGTVANLYDDDKSALNGLLVFYAFLGGGVQIYNTDKKSKDKK